MKRSEIKRAQARARKMFDRAGIALTPAEQENIEIADFGLGEFEKTGLALVTYVNTARVCAKELVLLPGQTCPQHRHPGVGEKSGKEETFRCRMGTVYIYVPGPEAACPAVKPPAGGAYDVFHEIALRPGEQYTLMPDTWHWFAAGPEGAIVSEFSTTSTDEADIFLDSRIQRATKIEED